jgi:hypothetical protein
LDSVPSIKSSYSILIKTTQNTLFEVNFTDYDYILSINGQIRIVSRPKFSLLMRVVDFHLSFCNFAERINHLLAPLELIMTVPH